MTAPRSLIILTFFLLTFSAESLQAQNSGDVGYFLGVRANYGFLWAHRPTMSHLVNKHIPALEVSLWKTTNQTACWHRPYKDPQIGATFTIIPLGDKRLGTGIGLYPYVIFPVCGEGKKLSLNIQLGWGAGWVSKKFEPLENHQNNAIGSHFNTIILIRGTAKYDCTDKLKFEMGIGLTHFSNGGMTMPNLGLNIPTLEAGFHFRIAMAEEVCNEIQTARMIRTDSLVNDRHWHFTAIVAFGANDIGVPGGNRFGAANLQMSYMRNTARKHRFGGGIDVMYSQGVHHNLVYNDVPSTSLQAVQLGVKFSYELVLGRFYMPFEMGVYAISKYKESGMIYNRLCARYLINDHLIASISLKTHIARAEYWEVGMGWRL